MKNLFKIFMLWLPVILVSAVSAQAQWTDVGNPASLPSGVYYNDMVMDGSGNINCIYRPGSVGVGGIRYNGSSWSSLGSISSGGAHWHSLAMDNSGAHYVLFRDNGASSKATVVKRSTSGSWSYLGGRGFSATNIIDNSIVIYNGQPYAAFRGSSSSNYKLQVKRYTGSSWVNVGGALSSGNTSNVRLLIDNNNVLYVGYTDHGNGGKLSVKKYNGGSSWSLVGPNGISAGSFYYLDFEADGNNNLYVAYRDAANGNKLTVQKYNGSSWSVIGGSGVTSSAVSYVALTFDSNNNPLVVFSDYGQGDKTTVLKYNGSNWVAVGATGFTASYARFNRIHVYNGDIYVSTISNGKLTVKKTGVNTPSPLTATITAGGATTFCSGDSVVLTANSGAGYTYQWSLNGNPISGATGISYTATAGGSYTVTVTSGGNSGTSAATVVTVNSASAATVTASGATTFCTGGSVTLSASSASSYQWQIGGMDISGATGSSYTTSNSGNYSVKVTNANGCAATSSVTTVTEKGVWTPAGCPGISTSTAHTTALAVDTNGILYAAYTDASQSNKTTVQQYDGSSWSIVGTAGFSGAGQSQSLAVGPDNMLYMAVEEFGVGATVYKYNGSSWATVGAAGISPGAVNHTSLAIDDNGVLYVAFKDNVNGGKTSVMKYNGTTWVQVGATGISTGNAVSQKMAIDNNNVPYVAYADNNTARKLQVYKFNGTSWVSVGGPNISSGPAVSPTIAFDANNTLFTAYKDGFPQGPATVLKYNGTSWVTVGKAGFSQGYIDHITLAFDSQNKLIASYRDDANNLSITTQRFDNGVWTPIGAQGITTNTANQGSFVIDKNDNMYVAFRDFNSGSRLTVMKTGPAPVSITASGPTDFCSGSSVQLSVSACTGSSYQWMKNGTNISGANSGTYTANTAGTYKVSITSNGCAATSDVKTVTVRPTPDVDSIANQALCAGAQTDSVIFSGSESGTTFNWTNTNTSIGLGSSGSGNINPFTATNTGTSPVTSTITVTPQSGSPGFAYIASFGNNRVDVVNRTTNAIVSSITVGTHPEGVSVNADGSKVYVTNDGSNSVSVINTATNTVVSTISVGGSPSGVVVSPDGSRVYVANSGSNTVSVINTITNSVIATVNVGNRPLGITITPDGSKVYVGNYFGNNVSVISTATNTVVATIALTYSGSFPLDLVASPDGSKVYVSSQNVNYVYAINTATNTISASINIGRKSSGITISPDGNTVYTADIYTDNLSVINTTTNTLTATVSIGDAPYGVSISPDGSLVYINCATSKTVSVVSTASNTVVNTLTGFGNTIKGLGNFVTAQTPVCTGVSKSFTITVNPVTVITSCATSTTLSATTDNCSAPATYNVTATGATTPTFTYVFTGATTGSGSGIGSGSTFNVGVTNVMVVASDVCGNDTCTFTVTVVDNQNPTIACPADITVNADNGECSATNVTLGTPTTNDNCGVASTINNAPASFSVGTTTVTWTVTDVNGNTASCTQNVTVIDNQNPTITCSGDITVNADSGACTATNVNLGTPATADNCAVATTTNNAPSAFTVGTTTVTWSVTDASGNTATCTQNVTVIDNQNPTITCPADITVSADSGQCAATNVNLGNPTTNDNCGIEAVSNDAPASYPVGTTTVTWTVTDYNGNTNTCIQTVTVVDNQTPIVATQNQTIYLDASGSTSISTVDIDNGSTDNCGIDNMALNKTTFSCSDVGSCTVTLTVTDIHGNSATGTATVTVTDTVKPVITCPASVTVSCLTAPSNTGTATATDACGVDTITYADASTYSSNPADAAHYNYTITRTWTATDVNGNSNSCTQTINVQQLKLTSSVTNVLCNGDNSGSIDLSVSGGVGSLSYSWSNNATTEDISSLSAGTYTVTVTDSAGCSASATYTVTEPTMLSLTAVGVSPNPTVSGQSMNTIYLGYGPQSVTLSSTASGGTPGYSYSWSPTTGVNSPTSASTSVSPTVTTTYTLTATDANGCTKTVSKTIYVMDVTHGNNKIVICHNGKTKKVSVNAVQGHLNNGATLGECFKLKASKTKVTCYGGSDGALDVTVKGGVPPFSYSWSTGDTTEDLTGLSAGNYTLTVTAANNEVTTKTFKVKQNSKIKINKYIVDVKCHGDNTGKIYLSVSGGKPGYTYLWNDNSTSKHRFGLTAGTYSVTVKDSKGCTMTDTFAVTQPDSPLVVSASVTNVSCSNYYSGAIDLTVSGGTGPYTYYWSKNNQSWSWWWYWWWYNKCTKQDLSGISAGTYKVVVKDKNGCTVIKTVTVAPANKPNVSINVSPNPTVSGQAQYTIFKGYGAQSVTLSANVNGGTSPYTYSWTPTNSLSTSTASSTTASPNSTTKYYVKVTDADGCSKTVSRRIYVENVQWYNEKIRICHNGKNKKVPYNSVATYLANGATLGYCRYSCKGYPEPDEEGVDEDNTDEQSISSIGSLDDITNNIRLYPNPNTGTFTIELPSNEAADIVVSNVSGQVVYRNKVENTRKVLVELNSMAAGVFMVQVVQGLEIYHIKVTVN